MYIIIWGNRVVKSGKSKLKKNGHSDNHGTDYCYRFWSLPQFAHPIWRGHWLSFAALCLHEYVRRPAEACWEDDRNLASDWL